MDDSVMDDYAASSDNFSPVAAPKAAAKGRAKPGPKKAAAATTKAAPKKMTQTAAKPKAAASKKRVKPESDDETAQLDRSSLHDDSLLSVTPPSAKKQRGAGAAKKAGGKPLQDIENDGVCVDGAGDPKPKATKSATDQYQSLTPIQHILKRPDTYVGSVERTEKQMWVYNSQTEAMEMREVSFVPGLYKIFDEILVNAADNKQRDKNMDAIKVTIDRDRGEISVWNNGRGIPIEIHESDGTYIPQMIFGKLLTSSNYDDEQQKITGGRNGYGAKLCNIFSTEFHVETADSRTKQRYKQTWTDNMAKRGAPKITANKGDDYTKVTFHPDFAKFGMTGIDDDFEALVKRRVYDLAGTLSGVKVTLNGERVKIRNFKQYVEMYVKAIDRERNVDGEPGDGSVSTIITERADVRWEIGFAVSDGSFQQVSFVNSIATTSGGTHVNYICDQIIGKLMDVVKKKKDKSGVLLKSNQIRNHIFLFVNCSIVNPAFTSQTKEQLTTKASQFGSKCTVSDKFLKDIAKTEVVTNIMHFAQKKADLALKKTDGNRRSRMSNPKLTDANKAGTKDGWKCTLILTEGDSAKGLAMAGRSVVGPDEFGVFPLRGKLLNVRDASVEQISKNAEIQSIKQFLGLQHKKEYTDTRGLRYGHIMIMTDQDHDGSHIKGLLINFLQCSFPSLLKIPQFLIEFITPIVKVWKGDPKNPSVWRSFFTMPEYEEFREAHKHDRPVWEHKYYKGLGTSTTEDAQIYFRDLDRHLKEFHTMQEGEERLIELAFSKKKADERKEWLRQFKPGTYLDHSIDKISYEDFINKELILFSMADNMRSIPSVIDGLKPGQRKVLYTCFKRNLRKDVKVVELAGSVSARTAYHHGEASLQQTIVGLAQTFVGSNNVNCLEPSGNFGSRLQGGGDCASARYIYTRLSPFARRVFSPLDDPLLTYNLDDNEQIEPEIYCPVVPMVLINGADGIGTGWSSSIPNYNPEDVVANLRRLMDDEEPEPMVPWFRGWDGEVKQIAPERYKFSGKIQQTGDNEIEIAELPIRVWTQDFKDKLEEIIKADKVPSFIKDYTDYNTHLRVHFVIQMEEKHMKMALEEGLEEKFKLSKTIATSNLVAFDRHGRLQKYESVADILKEFYGHRKEFYVKRKAHQLSELQRELDRLTNQARFIQMIIDNQLVVSRKKKAELVAELKRKGFKPIEKVADAAKQGESEPAAPNDDDDEGAGDVATAASAYDYLLGMAIWSLTKERVDKLLQQIAKREEEVDALIKLSVKDLWNRDLDDFIAEWRLQLDDERKRARKVANLGRRASNKLKLGPKGPAAKKRKAQGDDPDDSDFGAAKPKKAGAVKRVQPDPKAAASFFGQFSPPPKPEKATAKGSKAAAAVAKATAPINVESSPFSVDGASDVNGGPVRTVPAGAKRAGAAPKVESSSETADFGISPARRPRAATKKPVRYGLSSGDDSGSDNGDDMLGDVSMMVKTVGVNMGDSATESRPLFSTSMSRRGSSVGPNKTRPKFSAKQAAEHSDDETNFSMLVPQTAQQKASASSIAAQAIPAIDDDSLDVTEEIAPALKGKKAGGKVAAVKEVAKKAPAAKAKKAPAKKASAGKAASKTSATKQSKKKVEVEDADEVDAIANDLLISVDENESRVVSPPPKASAGRAPRRAAAAKRKPVYLDTDTGEEESEATAGDFTDED
ncbi:MAG: DNA topoisomerase 2 [Thelocarpon impressellum]|nr:MAG: DNA topoisomerase 2 [Thelocarpon impressellum]